MFKANSSYPYRWALVVGGGASLLGLLIGFLAAGDNFRMVGMLLVGIGTVCFFLWRFEQASLCLLVVRSALDSFSAQGLPGAFALGLNGLILLYVAIQLLAGRRVQTDRFWWWFAAWVLIQGLWVVLLPLGGLGFGADYLPYAVRDWLRLFSWLMTYLMVMQLRGRMAPTRGINLLLMALVLPLIVAMLQVLVPNGLPAFLAINPGQVGYRVNGTLGLANTFAGFLILFISIVYWRFSQAQHKIPWLVLLGLLLFFLTTTKTLVGLVMLVVLIVVLMASQFSPAKLFGFALLLALTVALFASSEFGQARLDSVAQTPLLNPDMDISRSILLAASDQNSFNWRIAQWTNLLSAWSKQPILGYGLGTVPYLGYIYSAAHNDYVRALFDGGIVGFTTFIGFLGMQISRLVGLMQSPFSSPSQKQFCLSLLGFLIAAMVGMLTENIWSHTANFFYWYAFSAIAGWDWSQGEDLSSATPTRSRFQ
jgi:O-antigen ligase